MCYIRRMNELLFAIPMGIAAAFAFMLLRSEIR
jgi:hypothetical protein